MATSDHDRGQVPLRHSILLCLGLVILTALLYLPYLGHTTLIHEEPRRAIIAKNMMDSGDYFVPILHNRIYTAKPPLFNWLIIAASLPQGEITEFSARLPSVISLALLAVIMVLGMRKYLKLEGLIFLGLSIVLSIEFMSKAHLAEIEMAFTLLVTLSLWNWFWLDKGEGSGVRQWLLPLVMVALAFMAKGPPAIVFFYLAVIPFLIIKKRWREIFSLGHFVGFLSMSIIISGWILMMIKSTGIEALQETLKREVIYRGSSGSVLEYVKHILSYPFELFGAMLPFSFLMVPIFFRSVRRVLHSRYGDIYIFALLTVLANLPIYWFKSSASVRYFMPVFPSAMVLFALMFEIYRGRISQLTPRLSAALDKTVKTGSIIFIVFCFALTVSALLQFWEDAPPLLVPWYATLALGIATLLGSASMYRVASNNPRKALLPVLAGIMIVARMIYFCDVLPFKADKLKNTRNVHALLEEIESGTGGSAEPVKVIGKIPNDVWFYAKAGLLTQHEGAEDPDRGYFIGYEHELKALLSYQVLSRIPYSKHDMIFGMFSHGAK